MAGLTSRSRFSVASEEDGDRVSSANGREGVSSASRREEVSSASRREGVSSASRQEGVGSASRREGARRDEGSSAAAAAPTHTESGNVVNVRGRVAVGCLLVFFGIFAVLGLLVNGYRSSIPYASFFAFFTLALCAKVLVGDPGNGSGSHYMRRANMARMGGRVVGSERIQYSRLNQRLSLVDRDFTPGDYDLLLELDNNSQRFRRFLEGASKGAVDRLPTYIFKAEQAASKTASNSGAVSVTKSGCTICLEDFVADEKIRILPCFHQFHLECVDRWLYQQAKCPVCKFMIVDVDDSIPAFGENELQS